MGIFISVSNSNDRYQMNNTIAAPICAKPEPAVDSDRGQPKQAGQPQRRRSRRAISRRRCARSKLAAQLRDAGVLDLQSKAALGGFAHRRLQNLRQLLQASIVSGRWVAHALQHGARAHPFAHPLPQNRLRGLPQIELGIQLAAQPLDVEQRLLQQDQLRLNCMSKRRAVSNSRSSTCAKEISLSGLLNMGSHTVRTADSSSSTRVPLGTQPDSTCRAATRA